MDRKMRAAASCQELGAPKIPLQAPLRIPPQYTIPLPILPLESVGHMEMSRASCMTTIRQMDAMVWPAHTDQSQVFRLPQRITDNLQVEAIL
mmetsp:Transcript_36181/g.66528  ORF Transcript_36181/g.66528 Transcript_36181/m.66528 type:complete len:92 (-) Transcript_36181:246-521(-)